MGQIGRAPTLFRDQLIILIEQLQRQLPCASRARLRLRNQDLHLAQAIVRRPKTL